MRLSSDMAAWHSNTESKRPVKTVCQVSTVNFIHLSEIQRYNLGFENSAVILSGVRARCADPAVRKGVELRAPIPPVEMHVFPHQTIIAIFFSTTAFETEQVIG